MSSSSPIVQVQRVDSSPWEGRVIVRHVDARHLGLVAAEEVGAGASGSHQRADGARAGQSARVRTHLAYHKAATQDAAHCSGSNDGTCDETGHPTVVTQSSSKRWNVFFCACAAS